MKSTGNTIVITGGGSGIGRALAHRFADQGNTVIVTGRTQGSLDEAIGCCQSDANSSLVDALILNSAKA